MGVDHAHRIGPEQPDAARLCRCQHAGLQRGTFRAGLREAIGQHASDRDAAGRTDGDLRFHLVSAQQDIGEVDRARNVVERGIGAFAHDLRRARVYREDLALEAVAAQIALRPRGEARHISAGADERHAARIEQRLGQHVGQRGHFGLRCGKLRPKTPSAMRFFIISRLPPAIIQPRVLRTQYSISRSWL